MFKYEMMILTFYVNSVKWKSGGESNLNMIVLARNRVERINKMLNARVYKDLGENSQRLFKGS
jgi:hypothetical protein